jgi:hypothetical protein
MLILVTRASEAMRGQLCACLKRICAADLRCTAVHAAGFLIEIQHINIPHEMASQHPA